VLTKFRFTTLRVVRFMTVFACSVSVVWASDGPLLTPEACTGLSYLAPNELTSRAPMVLSPNGTQIAYIMQKPNISTNTNSFELYVQPVQNRSHINPHPLLTMRQIVTPEWFDDNRHIVALVGDGDHVWLAQINAETGKYQTIYKASGDITDYSMSGDGRVIAIAVHSSNDHTIVQPTEQETATGYRVDLQAEAPPIHPLRTVEILEREGDGHYICVERVRFKSPLSGDEIAQIVDNHSTHINLSPNGRYLLLDNWESIKLDNLPWTWRESKLAKYIADRFAGFVITYLYDLKTKRVSLPLQSPVVRDSLWSPDSRSFALRAVAPVGSQWEKDDLQKGAPSDHSTHLFVVNVGDDHISEVLDRVEKPPLTWTKGGQIIVRDEAGAVRGFQNVSGRWESRETIHIPLSDLSPYGALVTDGRRFVGEYENAETSPRLFEYVPPSKAARIITELDPQIDAYVLPHSKAIEWTTSTGYHAKGVLLIPPHYDPSRRYPLVVEDGSIQYSGEFVCDSGPAHVSSFVRGILADEGVMYLMRSWLGVEDWENNYFPKGYPGTLAETVFRMDLVESAVRHLDGLHIIDPARVGIIGFSRGGWYAEYALAHSAVHFAAATITDNIQYSVGEYWYYHKPSIMESAEAVYGGPPYGKSIKNWRDYSISFNLDKIHTPIMMEVMGYGEKNRDVDLEPSNLAMHHEVFVGLRRLGRPVEMYYYPNEQHQPDHPIARIASLQRNVDWFRFWLQGYERPDPSDPDQYTRWRRMRDASSSFDGK
jgi:dipeptidyl aminopeptidase/acylaminoacyl peptidase